MGTVEIKGTGTGTGSKKSPALIAFSKEPPEYESDSEEFLSNRIPADEYLPSETDSTFYSVNNPISDQKAKSSTRTETTETAAAFTRPRCYDLIIVMVIASVLSLIISTIVSSSYATAKDAEAENKLLRTEIVSLKSKIENITFHLEHLHSVVHNNITIAIEENEGSGKESIKSMSEDIKELEIQFATVQIGFQAINHSIDSIHRDVLNISRTIQNNTEYIESKRRTGTGTVTGASSRGEDHHESQTHIYPVYDYEVPHLIPERIQIEDKSKHMEEQIEAMNETIISALETISSDILDIRNSTGALKVELDIVKKIIKPHMQECGGLINLPRTQEELKFNYISASHEIGQDERCLWTLVNTVGASRDRVSLTITVISESYQGTGGGLYALKWNRDSHLASQKLVNGTEYDFSSEGLFLSFNSETDSHNSKSFYIQILVTDRTSGYPGSHWIFSSSPGRKAVRSYGDNDQVSIVINPQKSIRITLDSLHTEECCDYLIVYEIKEGGIFIAQPVILYEPPRIWLALTWNVNTSQFEPITDPTNAMTSFVEDPLYSIANRLKGSIPSRLLLTTSYPVLAIFTSDGSQTRDGFTLSWA